MEKVRSIAGVPIRLTGERWTHIVENHDEMAGRLDDVLEAIAEPAWVTKGYGSTRIAWRSYRRRTWMAVVYREVNKKDGFVITAFLTGKPKRSPRLWP